MLEEQETPTPSPTRKTRRRKSTDEREYLHTRLERFLENPINPATLDSLVAGLVDYELRVRLTTNSTPSHTTYDQPNG